jgi:hypothetical protein
VLLASCSEQRAQNTDAATPPSATRPVTSAPTVVDASAPADATASDAGDGGRDQDAFAEQAMQKIEDVAVLIAANKKDCTVLGVRLKAYYDDNAAFVIEAKEAYGVMEKTARKALQQRLRKRFDSAWMKLQPTIKKCKDEPNVASVLDKVF